MHRPREASENYDLETNRDYGHIPPHLPCRKVVRVRYGDIGREATTLAATVASLEIMTKMALYYIHERSWARLDWGIEAAPQA